MPDFIKINPEDNVAIALRFIPPGTHFEGVTVREEIPQGHKIALVPISQDENVVMPQKQSLLAVGYTPTTWQQIW